MHDDELRIEEFRGRMTIAGEPGPAIGIFLRYFQQLIRGADPAIPETSILPLSATDVVDMTSLPDASGESTDALQTTVVIKLSDGLGTSMGLEVLKAAIEAKDDRSFLDISLAAGRKGGHLAQRPDGRLILREVAQCLPDDLSSFQDIALDLDPAMVRDTDRLAAHFPLGPPSLVMCEPPVVRGDVKFGRNVVLKGHVEIRNQQQTEMVIEDGTVIKGSGR